MLTATARRTACGLAIPWVLLAACRPHVELAAAQKKDASVGDAQADAPMVEWDADWTMDLDARSIVSSVTRTRAQTDAPLDAPARGNCTYTRGAMPAETLDPGTHVGGDIPIEHIVVVMQENRSFDSYFARLGAYEAKQGIDNVIEAAPENASNPSVPAKQPGDDGGADFDAGIGSHVVAHAPYLCFADLHHSWGDLHLDYDDGRNDGFYFDNGGPPAAGPNAVYASPERVLWWYDERDIPYYYDLYSAFAMADHYFCDVLGPTYPNRMYLFAATSFGVSGNYFPDLTAYPFPGDGHDPGLIFDALQLANIPWGIYAEGAPSAGVVLGADLTTRYPTNPVHSFAAFMNDVQNGTLPAVSFVDADFSSELPNTDDEHPPSEIELGQHFVWRVVNAITTGPSWTTTALFVTYDENGGIYDHVPPPPACPPDRIAPTLYGALDQSEPGGFDRYGFRVPFLLVSPYAKASYVSHLIYSHASILRFIEAKENLPALTSRDANSDDLDDLFDWDFPPFMTPPVFPEPTVQSEVVAQCMAALSPDAGP